MVETTNKETIKRLLVEFREEGVPDDLKDRKVKVYTEKKKAALFTGIRRAGKTYRMFQKIKDLKEEDVFYINFEDERLINPTVEDLSQLLPTIKETFVINEPIYLFVDEVQRIDGWERWARRLAESDSVYLTISGSSSQLSSREIASSLRGRTLTTHIFPLNFQEFLDFKGFEIEDISHVKYSKEKPILRRHFNEYLKFGGFPEIVLEEKEKRKLKILREYFSTIVARDLIERHSIEKVNVLESLMKLLVNNFSRLISFSKTRNWLKSMGLKVSKNTIANYFSYLKSSYFLFDVTIHSRSVKDRLQYPRKVYLIDNGFATSLTERFSSDRGWFFENLVAVNLFREIVSNPQKELHYWKKDRKEVDFVVKEGLDTKELIQVCSDLYVETKERELKNLLVASEELECSNLTVITDDLEDEEEIDGKKVDYVPLWVKLLEIS
ncbi:MAG: ATP-binding protein [Candidatus Natronoplasma sp.]